MHGISYATLIRKFSNFTARVYDTRSLQTFKNLNIVLPEHYLPLPLSTATGPPLGSQFHHGPVILTELALVHTVVVTFNTLAYTQEPSSRFAFVRIA